MEGKGLKRFSAWVCMGAFWLVCFLYAGDAMGQCVPLYRGPISEAPDEVGGYINGSDQATAEGNVIKIPVFAIPPGCPGLGANTKASAWIFSWGCTAGEPEGWHWVLHSSKWAWVYTTVGGGGCGANQFTRGFKYTFYTGVLSGQDFDCDGLYDSGDTGPTHYGATSDADADGIMDQYDSEPDNASCPTGGHWQRWATYTARSNGCTVQVYKDLASVCLDVYVTSCSSLSDYDFANRNNWVVVIDVQNKDSFHTWAEIAPADLSQTKGTGGEFIDPNTKGGGGITGTRATTAGSTNDWDYNYEWLESIQKNTFETVKALRELISGSQIGDAKVAEAVKNQEVNVNVEMGGVEDRLDTANTALGGIHDDMPKMGTEELPDGETSEITDDTLYNEEARSDHEDEARTAFQSLLDGFLSENPIISWIGESGVEASGGSSSVSFSYNGGSVVMSAVELGNMLDSNGVGDFFLALCGLAGVLAVLRD